MIHKEKRFWRRLSFVPSQTQTRSLDLSRVRRHFQKKSGRQTGKQLFFKKTFEIVVYLSKLLLYYSEAKKRNEKPLKPFCDGPTDRRTDGATDQPKSGL